MKEIEVNITDCSTCNFMTINGDYVFCYLQQRDIGLCDPAFPKKLVKEVHGNCPFREGDKVMIINNV